MGEMQAANEETVSVGPFTWGSSGAFAINLWAQQRYSEGDLFQYLLSARSKNAGSVINATQDMYTANQVGVYALKSSRYERHASRHIMAGIDTV